MITQTKLRNDLKNETKRDERKERSAAVQLEREPTTTTEFERKEGSTERGQASEHERRQGGDARRRRRSSDAVLTLALASRTRSRHALLAQLA